MTAVGRHQLDVQARCLFASEFGPTTQSRRVRERSLLLVAEESLALAYAEVRAPAAARRGRGVVCARARHAALPTECRLRGRKAVILRRSPFARAGQRAHRVHEQVPKMHRAERGPCAPCVPLRRPTGATREPGRLEKRCVGTRCRRQWGRLKSAMCWTLQSLARRGQPLNARERSLAEMGRVSRYFADYPSLVDILIRGRDSGSETRSLLSTRITHVTMLHEVNICAGGSERQVCGDGMEPYPLVHKKILIRTRSRMALRFAGT
jgi:hypothetical protein